MDFLLECFVRAVGLPGRTIQYGEECGLSVWAALIYVTLSDHWQRSSRARECLP